MTLLLCMSFGVNSLLLSLLYKNLNTNRANRFLFSVLVLILVGTAYVVLTASLHAYPEFLSQIINASPVLIGPLSFLYVQQSLTQERTSNDTLVIHIAPFFLAFILSFFDSDQRTFLSFTLNVLLKVVLSLIYFSISFYKIKKSKTIYGERKNSFKIDITKDTYSWLFFMASLGLFSYFMYLLFVLMWWFEIPFSNNHLAYYANFLIAIFILTLSYYGLSKTNVFQQIQGDVQLDEKPVTDAKELLSLDKVEQLYVELVQLMTTEKLYLNENLSIDEVAKKMNVHGRYLSYVINKKTETSFFDFLNHYRVKEFNEQMLNPKSRQFTLLSIALECGFGSKSAFNRAYKKEMGSSPSTFLKSQNS